MGDSILNDIDHHDSSNEPFKARVKNHPRATADDICDHLKPEIRKRPGVVIIHAWTNDLINNSYPLENYKRMADSVRFRLSSCTLAMSNVITSKDKNEIGVVQY